MVDLMEKMLIDARYISLRPGRVGIQEEIMNAITRTMTFDEWLGYDDDRSIVACRTVLSRWP